MKHLFKSCLLFVAATAGSAGWVQAGTIGGLTTVVTPLSTQITYSRAASGSKPALVTRVGYTVAVGSATGNTLNNIVFTGAASVTTSGETAVFESADGATCTATPNSSSIRCELGQLKGNAAYPTFAVWFVAPQPANPMPPPNTDFVKFGGTTYYAEGTGGAGGPSPQNSTTVWSAADVVLGTFNPTSVKTGVSKQGGTVFTGDGLSTPSTVFTVTTVIDPSTIRIAGNPDPTYAIADLEISAPIPFGVDNCTNFVNCFKGTAAIGQNDASNQLIHATFTPYLTFILRVDASNIKPGTKIDGVQLYYLPDGLADVQANYQAIGSCANATTPLGTGIPCIAGKKYYKNKSVPGWTTDLDGDFEWTILNTNNGTFKIA